MFYRQVQHRSTYNCIDRSWKDHPNNCAKERRSQNVLTFFGLLPFRTITESHNIKRIFFKNKSQDLLGSFWKDFLLWEVKPEFSVQKFCRLHSQTLKEAAIKMFMAISKWKWKQWEEIFQRVENFCTWRQILELFLWQKKKKCSHFSLKQITMKTHFINPSKGTRIVNGNTTFRSKSHFQNWGRPF